MKRIVVATMLVVFLVALVGTPTAKAAQNEKSPVVALLLSMLLTGLGQYYNGEPTKALIQESMVVGGAALAVTVGTDDVMYTEHWYILGEYIPYTYTEKELNGVGVVGVLAAVSGSLWSIIDAPISASRINRESGYNRSLLLDVKPRNGGLALNMSYRF